MNYLQTAPLPSEMYVTFGSCDADTKTPMMHGWDTPTRTPGPDDPLIISWIHQHDRVLVPGRVDTDLRVATADSRCNWLCLYFDSPSGTPMDKMVQLLRPFRGVAYTTAFHQAARPEGEERPRLDIPCDRYRAILPYSRPVNPYESKRIHRLFAADYGHEMAACCDVYSVLYSSPSASIIKLGGKSAIDVDRLLQECDSRGIEGLDITLSEPDMDDDDDDTPVNDGSIPAQKSVVPMNILDYYETQQGMFIVKEPDGNWVPYNESAYKRILKERGISGRVPKFSEDELSPIDRYIRAIQTRHSVYTTLPRLSGQRSGLVEFEGNKVLIQKDCNIPQGADVPWDNLKLFIDTLCDNDPEQIDVLYSWMHCAYVALRDYSTQSGTALALCGEPGGGKTFFQIRVLTPLMGGQQGLPWPWLTGRTNFNGELAGSMHLCVSDGDPQGIISFSDRRTLAARIKAICVNPVQAIHPKYHPSASMPVLWRLTFSLNHNDAGLKLLPPLENGVEDKITILKTGMGVLPGEGASPGDSNRINNAMAERELPGLIRYLEGYKVPEWLRDDRFGSKSWHNKEITGDLYDLTPNESNHEIIQKAMFDGVDGDLAVHTCTAMLKRIQLSYGPKRTCPFKNPAAIGYALKDLADQHPGDFYSKKRQGGNTVWCVKRDWDIAP